MNTPVTCNRLTERSSGHSFRNLLLLILGILALAIVRARGDLEIGASVEIHARAEFETPLAAHGTWIEVGSYGRCWRPAHVAVGWRPYCSGSWVWTDSGWYWASDEPWAWACYHYGRWVYDGEVWIWIPGVEWAPAWVSWRVGRGHIGWAPMAPVGWVSVSKCRPLHCLCLWAQRILRVRSGRQQF